jgi:hypothetical protein
MELGGIWIAGGFFACFLAERHHGIVEGGKSARRFALGTVLIAIGVAILLGVPVLAFGMLIFAALRHLGMINQGGAVLAVLYTTLALPLAISIGILTYRELPP